MSDSNPQSQMSQPDPALKRLDKLVGTWTLSGRTLNSEEDNISGQTTFEWLPGGFFLQQRIEMDFMVFKIKSLELVGLTRRSKRSRQACTPTCRPRHSPISGTCRTTR